MENYMENYEIISGGHSDVEAFIWKVKENGAVNVRTETIRSKVTGELVTKVIYSYPREEA